MTWQYFHKSGERACVWRKQANQPDEKLFEVFAQKLKQLKESYHVRVVLFSWFISEWSSEIAEVNLSETSRSKLNQLKPICKTIGGQPTNSQLPMQIRAVINLSSLFKDRFTTTCPIVTCARSPIQATSRSGICNLTSYDVKFQCLNWFVILENQINESWKHWKQSEFEFDCPSNYEDQKYSEHFMVPITLTTSLEAHIYNIGSFWWRVIALNRGRPWLGIDEKAYTRANLKGLTAYGQ